MRVSEAWVSSVEKRLAALGAPEALAPRPVMPHGTCRRIAEAVCAARGLDLAALLGRRGVVAVSECPSGNLLNRWNRL